MNLIYTYDIFSAQKYGGISRYFYELIRRISSHGAQVRVPAGLYINEYAKGLNALNGLKVPPIPYTGFIRKKINKLLQKVMLQSSDDETIIHQTYYYPFSFPKKAKLVVTVYDMIHERFHPSLVDASNIKRKSCKRADMIIAISHSTKNDLVELFGIDPQKVTVIHLASSLRESPMRPDTEAFSEPYMLYVGERKGYKNFDGLIKAFSQSKMLMDNFHIICFGGSSFEKREMDLFKKTGVASLLHQVSGGDAYLASHYRKASAFVCPSLYEGFGLPLLEAMSLSCPVICSNTSSIPEVAGDAAVYFDPNDISSIQRALEDALFDKDLLVDLKRRGLERELIFSWDKCANETLAVYNSLLQ